MKYLLLPIKDDNDVEIMFDVLNLHEELSNIDLYLEIEVNCNKNPIGIASRTQERSSLLLPTMGRDIAVSDMIRNDDFNTISQCAVVNNAMSCGFDTKERDGICLISDRHSGILKVVNEQGSPWLQPQSFHRYCLRHFVNNFHDKFRNSQLKGLAYRAGSQNQVRKFNSIMEEIRRLNPQARQWLEGHSLCRWTLSHDGGKRYGLLTTNMSEIFNSVLKGARFLPITPCVQITFYRLVNYFDVRRCLGSIAQDNGDVFTLHVVAKQAATMSKASAHTLKSFNRAKGIFEVITRKGKNMQVVDLEKKTCTCGKWEIQKYPCSHVLSGCAYLSLSSCQYIQQYYSIYEYSATWASEFFPVPHEAYWPQTSTREMLPNERKKVVLVRQGYGMEWTLRKEKMLIFVEIVDKPVTIRRHVLLGLEKGLLIHNIV